MCVNRKMWKRLVEGFLSGKEEEEHAFCVLRNTAEMEVC